MANQYATEQFKKVYRALPEGLKNALGSVEIQDEIEQICRENGVTDNAVISKVYNLVMDTFMGLVLPENLDEEIRKIVRSKKSGEIAHRIQRFIIFPLKSELIQLHNVQVATQVQGASIGRKTSAEPALDVSAEDDYIVAEEEKAEQEVVEEPKTKQADPYREAPE